MKKFAMTQEEAQLVVDSIVKWEMRGIYGDCPLCMEYAFLVPEELVCKKCPITRYTGEEYCEGDSNPYYKIQDGDATDQDMIDFLTTMLADAGYYVAEVDAGEL